MVVYDVIVAQTKTLSMFKEYLLGIIHHSRQINDIIGRLSDKAQ